MQKRSYTFHTVILFLVVAVIVFLIAKTSFGKGIIETVLAPVVMLSGSVRSIVPSFESETVQKLREENLVLMHQVKEQEELKRENSALRDQFETATIPHASLVPARVVGMPQFIPNTTVPVFLTLGIGEKNGITTDMPVIYKDALVGVVDSTSSYFSRVKLIVHDSFRTTAKDVQTDALGVAQGEGSSMILSNVLPSVTLAVDDIVTTTGDIAHTGKGIPEGLILGKIVSVDKKSSASFQSAKVQSPIIFSSLSTVFIMTAYEE